MMNSLRAWMRRHRFLSSLILFFFFWRIFWWHFDTPIRNPWPQDSYIVKGRFPFHKGYDLIFIQHVYGGSAWHQRVCGMLSLTNSAKEICGVQPNFSRAFVGSPSKVSTSVGR